MKSRLRTGLLAIPLLTFWAQHASATSFSVIDPFGQPACPAGVTTGCDVVGSVSDFDFKRADISTAPTSTTIQLYFNYGPASATNLQPFAITANTIVSIADIFLKSGSTTFAIPLFNRTTASWGNATAGTVYQANDAGALLNSDLVLNNPSDIPYRAGVPVWIDTTNASVASVGSITVQSGAAQGTKWLVTLNFSYAAGSLFANAINDPSLQFSTASATCGCDLVSGPSPATVPESGTLALLGLGLAGLGLSRRRKAA